MFAACLNKKGSVAGQSLYNRKFESLSLRSSGYDADGFFTLRPFDREQNLSCCGCKQRMVLADADVDARVELGAALADDDVARDDGFAAVDFYAQAFRFRVATVA